MKRKRTKVELRAQEVQWLEKRRDIYLKTFERLRALIEKTLGRLEDSGPYGVFVDNTGSWSSTFYALEELQEDADTYISKRIQEVNNGLWDQAWED